MSLTITKKQTLKNVVLRTLDLGLLQAGASVKGEFENRLRIGYEIFDQRSSRPRKIHFQSAWGT